MKSMMLYSLQYFDLSSLLILVILPQYIKAYCKQDGMNASFLTSPSVRQMSNSTFRVSWKVIVQNKECVDGFLVKYREKEKQNKPPNDPFLSYTDDGNATFMDIDVLPGRKYILQVIATEETGRYYHTEGYGEDFYAVSPEVNFRTSEDNTPTGKCYYR